MRLVGSELTFNDRVHFYAVAARLLRHILVDHAKSLNRAKRGGGAANLSLDEALVVGQAAPIRHPRPRRCAPASRHPRQPQSRSGRTPLLRRTDLRRSRRHVEHFTRHRASRTAHGQSLAASRPHRRRRARRIAHGLTRYSWFLEASRRPVQPGSSTWRPALRSNSLRMPAVTTPGCAANWNPCLRACGNSDELEGLVHGAARTSCSRNRPCSNPAAASPDYEILSLLGAGGMGQVYLAQDLRLRRKVAIKTLNPDPSTTATALADSSRKRCRIRPESPQHSHHL